ncbi:MAG: Protoheme farnesyltransferase [Patescibacteria group bacterium]|nr:Protoheme farnesyltransferase [Patescibacteria group bacterium]
MIPKTIQRYYRLTKPGIIYGNAITAAAGFLLASRGHISAGLLVGMLAGISLVMAGACVFNNYIDRGLDRKMARTKDRSLAKGSIPGRNALIYASVLGLLGFGLLALWTNMLTVGVALVGFVVYVVLYGLAKRRSVHGTLVGSISGAVPPVVGYCAVTGQFDGGALLLFVILTLWQMPHFYAIAMYRLKDYTAAGLPVLPVKYGPRAAKIQILVYIVAFMAAVAALTVAGYTGYTYLAVMLVLSAMWLQRAIKGFRAKDDAVWARGLFRFSLIVLLGFSAMISIDILLP